MITLGTGVGSGIVVDGRVVYGSDGFAGELGHVVIDHSEAGRQCGCGRKGCLETYCSATGVARTAREFLSKSDAPSPLRDIDPEKITSFDVFQAAEKGDKIALEIFEFTGQLLGRTCADFATFNTPEAFVFFGGLAKAGEYLMEPLRRAYDDTCSRFSRLRLNSSFPHLKVLKLLYSVLPLWVGNNKPLWGWCLALSLVYNLITQQLLATDKRGVVVLFSQLVIRLSIIEQDFRPSDCS